MVFVDMFLETKPSIEWKVLEKISGDDGPNGTSAMACQISQEFHDFLDGENPRTGLVYTCLLCLNGNFSVVFTLWENLT